MSSSLQASTPSSKTERKTSYACPSARSTSCAHRFSTITSAAMTAKRVVLFHAREATTTAVHDVRGEQNRRGRDCDITSWGTTQSKRFGTRHPAPAAAVRHRTDVVSEPNPLASNPASRDYRCHHDNQHPLQSANMASSHPENLLLETARPTGNFFFPAFTLPIERRTSHVHVFTRM